MDKVIDRLSSYNLFTNLFPGLIYCYLASKFFGVPLLQSDLLVAAFYYYFCGLVISRVGSILIEPILKKTKIAKFAAYDEYAAAAAKDPQIGILLETSNTYRSVIALLICVLITGAWAALLAAFPNFSLYTHHVLLFGLVALFLFAYRKQTQYIVSRINLYKKSNGTEP
jgi:hypothetical protein